MAGISVSVNNGASGNVWVRSLATIKVKHPQTQKEHLKL